MDNSWFLKELVLKILNGDSEFSDIVTDSFNLYKKILFVIESKLLSTIGEGRRGGGEGGSFN